jgi:hypothetical protein
VTDKQELPKPPAETPLITESEFADAMKAILSTTKRESDEQMARLQASNKARRNRSRPDS